MLEETPSKNSGGVAPFGYRWKNGELVVDEKEATVRKLIYDLFLKHRRKKTVAKLLNNLGYRTRSGSLFSDTTVDRLLRDSTAKGIRIVNGQEIKVEPVVDKDIWERANNILASSKPAKQTAHLFTGIVFCSCGSKMIVPSNSSKYACLECRHQIPTDDLEEIFVSQLSKVPFEIDSKQINLSGYWDSFTPKEKRIIVEQICDRIKVGPHDIEIEFAYSAHSLKTATDWQQMPNSNETVKESTKQTGEVPLINEPLLSEAEAAEFLGISKMTLLRKRNAGNIGFFRVGFRVLYSKEKHLMPFLNTCEK